MRAHLHDFHNVVSAPARVPRSMIAALQGVTFGLALDVLWAASDADTTFSISEVEIWAAVDTGTLAT